jgi:hypothetical protein
MKAHKGPTGQHPSRRPHPAGPGEALRNHGLRSELPVWAHASAAASVPGRCGVFSHQKRPDGSLQTHGIALALVCVRSHSFHAPAKFDSHFSRSRCWAALNQFIADEIEHSALNISQFVHLLPSG